MHETQFPDLLLLNSVYTEMKYTIAVSPYKYRNIDFVLIINETMWKKLPWTNAAYSYQ